jgi:2-oxoisovalerate dehydrogenase E1 component
MNNSIHFFDEIKKAVLIRLVEEKLLSLFAEGELNGTVHTAVGQEFVSVFVSKYLSPEDFVTSNHRGHGHYLARFGNTVGLMAEIMGRQVGVSGGYGGSQHLVDDNFISNGIQGGMLPIAAGVALYNKRKKNASISVAYIGDGTLGEGIVYEVLNLASILELPMLVVLENNGYAQSTSYRQTFRGDLAKRAEGFGVQFFKTSTFDLNHLDKTCMWAIEQTRNIGKPVLLEIETYRLNSHSKGDDNRDKSEIEEYRSRDPLTSIMKGADPIIQNLINDTRNDIDQIVTEIKSEPLLTSVSKGAKLSNFSRLEGLNPEIQSNDRYNTLIYQALKHVFDTYTDAIILGEDIQNRTEYTSHDYGGAFKVTRDLSDLFPDRVLNTPISESAIFGLVSGYALKAGRSFVEIMFGDFTTLIFDQVLQHASKFERMYGGKISCPVVVRTPMGGKRGYGPTHSQSLEKHFLGIDNFAVIALNHRICPDYVYWSIMQLKSTPVMVIENKILYTLDTGKPRLPSYLYAFSSKMFPELVLSPKSSKATVTVLCYGEVLNEVENSLYELILEEEIFCDVVCPSLLSEVDIAPLVTSLKKTGRLVIVEEGSGYASFGSEVVSELVRSGFTDFKLRRACNNHVIPSSFKAEMNILPGKVKIKETIIEINSI